MLKQRVTTAVTLLPVVLLLFFMVELDLFALAIASVVFMLGVEWARLAGFKEQQSQFAFAVSVSLLNLLIWWLQPNLKMWPSPSWPMALVWDSPMVAIVIGVVANCIAAFIVFTYSNNKPWWANKLVRGVLGLLLLPALFVSLVSIRKVAYIEDSLRGGLLVLFMFCLIWSADTGAYFAGKAFGKTKLAPIVSPNKTWEGVIGGLCLSLAIAWTGVFLLKIEVSNGWVFSSVVILLAAVSVIGDLFESAMKRISNIKDSGNILPGHGGLFDRLDSTIAVAPLFFISFSYFGWL